MQPRIDKKLIWLLTGLLVILVIWDLLLHLIPVKTTFFHYLYNAGYAVIFSVGGIFGTFLISAPQLSNTVSRAIRFIGLGLLSWTAGLIIWVFYNVALGIEVPYPSVADLFFILYIPLFGLGLSLLLWTYRISITLRHKIEVLLTFVIAAITTFLFIYQPDLSRELPLT